MIGYKVTKTLSETTGESTFSIGERFECAVSVYDNLQLYRNGQELTANAEMRTFELFEKGSYVNIYGIYYQIVWRELIEEMTNIYYLAEIEVPE